MLQDVSTHEQYLSSEPLQGQLPNMHAMSNADLALSNASSSAVKLSDAHAGQTKKTAEISAEFQQRMLAYNDLVRSPATERL